MINKGMTTKWFYKGLIPEKEIQLLARKTARKDYKLYKIN